MRRVSAAGSGCDGFVAFGHGREREPIALGVGVGGLRLVELGALVARAGQDEWDRRDRIRIRCPCACGADQRETNQRRCRFPLQQCLLPLRVLNCGTLTSSQSEINYGLTIKNPPGTAGATTPSWLRDADPSPRKQAKTCPNWTEFWKPRSIPTIWNKPAASMRTCWSSSRCSPTSGCAPIRWPSRDVLLLFQRGSTEQTVTMPGGTIPGHDGSGRLHVAFAIGKDDQPRLGRASRRRTASRSRAAPTGRAAATASISAIPTAICWNWRRPDCGRVY